MKLDLLISDILNTPPSYFFPKLRSILSQKSRKSHYLKRDLNQSSFKKDKHRVWIDFFNLKDLTLDDSEKSNLEIISHLHANHKFDILEDSWKTWSFPQNPDGFLGSRFEQKLDLDIKNDRWIEDIVNSSNLEVSRQYWKLLKGINSEYEPIDWQRDMRSGYSFGYKTHFSEIKLIPGIKGVDVKVPWEMGRLQHLPGMTLFAIKTANEKLLDEVKCQILDFILSNPPRWGIQWTSAMDAGIRAFNLSVVVSMLNQYNDKFAHSKLVEVMKDSIGDHLNFCYEFREHKNGLSNNHYLANLLGLIASAYCLDHNEMLEFAVKEMIGEIEKQFLEDGGNFESSIPYHFFSSEMAILGLTLIHRSFSEHKIKVETLIEKKLERLSNTLYLSRDFCEMAHNEGNVVQIGDNDSSRFFYWYPAIKSVKGDEQMVVKRNCLDYTSTLDMLNSFFQISHRRTVHSNFIQSIWNGKQKEFKIKSELLENGVQVPKLKFLKETIYKSSEDVNLKEELIFKQYPVFGWYVFSGKNLFLSVNGTNRHVKQYWPHGHNDKLSIELWINGKPLVRDPGSFVYTADPIRRNEYRGSKAHAGILFESEMQNTWAPGINGVFRMKRKTRVKLLSILNRPDSIAFMATYSGIVHIREIHIEESQIRILDRCNKDFQVNQYPEIAFSCGYGRLEKE